MKRFFIVILIIIIGHKIPVLRANNEIDSLITALDGNSQPAKKIAILSRLVELSYGSNFERSYEYANRLKILANKYGTLKDMADAAFALGKVYRFDGQFDLALENYLNAVGLFRKAGLNLVVADVFNAIGYIFYKVQEYEQAKHYYYDALFLYQKYGSSEDIIRTNFNLSTCFRREKKYIEALNYTTKALKLGKRVKDQVSINKTYNYIGIIYFEKGDYQLARENYLSSIKSIDGKENKSLRLSYAYNNIGETYREEGDLSRAHEYFQKALIEKQKLNQPELTSSTLLNIGKLYLMENEYVRAIDVLNEAIAKINPKIINESLTETIKEITKAYKMASAAGLHVDLEPLIAYNELLGKQFKLTNEMSKNLMAQHNQYMLDKSFEKQALQANIGQLQSTKLYLIWAGVLIIVVFLVLIFLMNRALKKAQRKSQEIVQTLNQMKGVLGKSFQRMLDDDTFTITTKK